MVLLASLKFGLNYYCYLLDIIMTRIKENSYDSFRVLSICSSIKFNCMQSCGEHNLSCGDGNYDLLVRNRTPSTAY